MKESMDLMTEVGELVSSALVPQALLGWFICVLVSNLVRGTPGIVDGPQKMERGDHPTHSDIRGA